MSNHFLDTKLSAEDMRHWQLVLCIQPKPSNELGLREILESILIHERQFKTQCRLDFCINGLNPVRVHLEAYCLKYQYDNPQETSTRTAWGDDLRFFASLCDVFGHQRRLTAGFMHGPLSNLGFQLDGEGNVVQTIEYGDGGG